MEQLLRWISSLLEYQSSSQWIMHHNSSKDQSDQNRRHLYQEHCSAPRKDGILFSTSFSTCLLIGWSVIQPGYTLVSYYFWRFLLYVSINSCRQRIWWLSLTSTIGCLDVKCRPDVFNCNSLWAQSYTCFSFRNRSFHSLFQFTLLPFKVHEEHPHSSSAFERHNIGTKSVFSLDPDTTGQFPVLRRDRYRPSG